MEAFFTIVILLALFGFVLKRIIKTFCKANSKTYQTEASLLDQKMEGDYYRLQYESVNISAKKYRKQYNSFVVLDFETTGLEPYKDCVVEVAALKIDNGCIGDCYTTLVNPQIKIPNVAYKIHGISDEMVKYSPVISEVLPDLVNFIGDRVVIAHNASFDMKFLLYNAYKLNIQIKNPVIDTLSVVRKLYPYCSNHKLGTIANYLKINCDGAHRSLADVTTTAKVFLKCLEELAIQDAEKDRERKAAKEQKLSV